MRNADDAIIELIGQLLDSAGRTLYMARSLLPGAKREEMQAAEYAGFLDDLANAVADAWPDRDLFLRWCEARGVGWSRKPLVGDPDKVNMEGRAIAYELGAEIHRAAGSADFADEMQAQGERWRRRFTGVFKRECKKARAEAERRAVDAQRKLADIRENGSDLQREILRCFEEAPKSGRRPPLPVAKKRA